MPPRLAEDPNARSQSITTADLETHGVLNRKADNYPSFEVGIAADKGHRRSMEDSHSFVFDFASIRGQGFFAVFDGHAGKHAAEWCGGHFHETLLQTLRENPESPIPDSLNDTFHRVDEVISTMSNESAGKIHSGCTAVAAFLRIEDENGHQSFLTASPVSASNSLPDGSGELPPSTGDGSPKKTTSGSKIKQAFKSLANGSMSSNVNTASSPHSRTTSVSSTTSLDNKVIFPPGNTRRVLYCANAGDARGVLCRGGVALRLTYDHKGSDKQEAKRITDAGGFVMSGRVNGVLAVTRSLGDSSMKEFVVGAPYTTETEVCEEDEFLILACDGLWDVLSDQKAVDHVRDITNAQEAATALIQLALDEHSQDNITVMVIRFKQPEQDTNAFSQASQ